MTSTHEEIEVSYSASNEFFRLYLDEGMHYTSASYLTGEESLEEAQIQKCRVLYDYTEMTPDYDRYLSICVRAFENHWSSDVRMKPAWCPS